jgi:hypothetical protein
MFNQLKHFFIPHEGNDYKPHLFRELSVSVLIVAVLILFVASAGSSFVMRNTDLGAAVLPGVLVDLTNQNRIANSESALIRSSVLDSAAAMKAKDMASKNYFAHTSPEGLTPWYWFSQVDYNFIYAGENLAINFTESTDVENAWLASPTHRANLLNASFTEIGLATTDGIYNGTPTTFVVQMFGTPAVFASDNTEEVPAPLPPKKTPVKKPTTIPTQVATALSPVVKGETTTENSNLETLVDTKEFTAVKNTAVPESVSTPSTPVIPVQYSTWYERFLFNQPGYTNMIYKILMGAVFVVLMLMIIIEFRRQHPRNIAYGVLTFVILLSLVYINQTFLMPHFLI